MENSNSFRIFLRKTITKVNLIALYLNKLFKEGSEESTDLENSKRPIKTDITFLPDLQYKISPKKNFTNYKNYKYNSVWVDFPTSVARDTSTAVVVHL